MWDGIKKYFKTQELGLLSSPCENSMKESQPSEKSEKAE